MKSLILILTLFLLLIILSITYSLKSGDGLNHQGATQANVPCEEPPHNTRPKPPSDGDAHSNYLKLYNFTSVLVADDHGHSEYPYGERDTGQEVERMNVDTTAPERKGMLITLPADGAYTITFQAAEGVTGNLALVRGEGNTHPDLAMRYNDLPLPKGATAMLRLTPQGVEPLRLDKDGDGTFEATLEPDAFVTGPAANDTYGPTICFSESRRGAKTVVTIRAVDSSGVASESSGDEAVYYSLDPVAPLMNFRLYTGPFEVEAANAPEVFAYADDKVGNRGSNIYKIKSQE